MSMYVLSGNENPKILQILADVLSIEQSPEGAGEKPVLVVPQHDLSP